MRRFLICVPGMVLLGTSFLAGSGQTISAEKHPILVKGKAKRVCNAYLAELKRTAALGRHPVCNLESPAEEGPFRKITWESLDVLKNIDIAYQAEMGFGIYRNHPERHPPFQGWRDELEREMESGKTRPRLMEARVELVAGKTQTLVGYVRNEKGCDADLEEMGASGNIGYHLFFRDEISGKLVRDMSGSYASDFGGTVLIYREAPHLINAVPTGTDVYVYRNRPSTPVWAPEMLCHIRIKGPLSSGKDG